MASHLDETINDGAIVAGPNGMVRTGELWKCPSGAHSILYVCFHGWLSVPAREVWCEGVGDWMAIVGRIGAFEVMDVLV